MPYQDDQTDDLWKRAILPSTATIEDAVRNLEEFGIQIVLVVDETGVLLGTVSDGDIRRKLLQKQRVDDSIMSVVHANPLVVPVMVEREVVQQIMQMNKIRQVPIIDEAGRVVGLHLWDQITAPKKRSNIMVIMAGGGGTRLRPHTENCPKPMLEIGGKPMLQHIIERAKREGFHRFVISLHYLGHMIEDYFGSGERLDVEIEYLHEDSPLGTGGALSLFTSVPDETVVITNGDVITDLRYGKILDFHDFQQATATMAVRLEEWQNPFGVVKIRGVDIIGFEEKPTYSCHINAGIYVLEPQALTFLDSGVFCDMPTLFERLSTAGLNIMAYPMHEKWLDVGRLSDFEKAEIECEQAETESKQADKSFT